MYYRRERWKRKWVGEEWTGSGKKKTRRVQG